MKIYQVCREYYGTIIKTFLSKKEAEEFKNEYLKSQEWKNNYNDTEGIIIHEYKVE